MIYICIYIYVCVVCVYICIYVCVCRVNPRAIYIKNIRYNNKHALGREGSRKHCDLLHQKLIRVLVLGIGIWDYPTVYRFHALFPIHIQDHIDYALY